MPGIRGLGGLLLLTAFLEAAFGEAPVAGLSPLEAASFVGLFGLIFLMAASVVDGFARHWTHGVQAVAVSGGMLLAVLVVYSARGELSAALDSVIGDIGAGRTVEAEGGGVVAARRSDGTFLLAGQVNGRDTRFIFDTGASTVVLRAEHAADLGFDEDALAFTIPVETANGTALAAPVILDSLTIGSITEHRVRALVTRSGALHANLLGMSFLERLGSYEVRGNRLILRPKSVNPAG